MVRPGFVPDADLPSFYSAGDAFVLPSFCEGFGLPLLEAMTCGCPVIAADNSSMPEVVGDAGLLVPAERDEAIAGAIREVLGDELLRARLVEKGREQAAKFTWDRCARSTLDTYRRVAGCSC